MSKGAFIFVPTKLSAQLSDAFNRPAIFKSVPKMAKDGRPIDRVAIERKSLQRAVAAFNGGSN